MTPPTWDICVDGWFATRAEMIRHGRVWRIWFHLIPRQDVSPYRSPPLAGLSLCVLVQRPVTHYWWEGAFLLSSKTPRIIATLSSGLNLITTTLASRAGA